MIYKYEVYYNSCFCLSGNPAFDALNGMGFQYDSCFYLSREEDKMEEIDYFNTTLVFINPTFLSHSSISIISLNLDIFNVFPLFPQPAVSF